MKLHQCGCERCKHNWFTRSKKLPKLCPNCNSPYWNKPRKAKKSPTPKKQPPKLPTRGRGGIFSTSASQDKTPPMKTYAIPKRRTPRRPTQREIDNAGIGGAT